MRVFLQVDIEVDDSITEHPEYKIKSAHDCFLQLRDLIHNYGENMSIFRVEGYRERTSR